MTQHMGLAADLCQTSDWSAITTAGNWVPFTGGIAGFIFAGLTFLLSATPTNQAAAARGFKLLLTAFFAFVALAYLSAGISGEQVCLRARTAHTIIGGILATAIIALCVALSWVLVSFGKYTQDALTFLSVLIYFALVLTAVMLTMSATSYYRSATGDSFSASTAWMTAFGVLCIIVGFLSALRTRRHPRNETQQEEHDKRRQRRVNQLATGTLAYLAASSIAAGLILTSPATAWEDPANWLIHGSAWGALVLPLLVLLTATGAIAHLVTDAKTTSTTLEQGAPSARKPDETPESIPAPRSSPQPSSPEA